MLANRCLPFDVGGKKTFFKVFSFICSWQCFSRWIAWWQSYDSYWEWKMRNAFLPVCYTGRGCQNPVTLSFVTRLHCSIFRGIYHGVTCSAMPFKDCVLQYCDILNDIWTSLQALLHFLTFVSDCHKALSVSAPPVVTGAASPADVKNDNRGYFLPYSVSIFSFFLSGTADDITSWWVNEYLLANLMTQA